MNIEHKSFANRSKNTVIFTRIAFITSFYKWPVEWCSSLVSSIWKKRKEKECLWTYHIVFKLIKVQRDTIFGVHNNNSNNSVFLWGQTNMAHPQCMIKYVTAIILFIYYTLFASHYLPLCVCACQQHWILCELLSPNTVMR